MIYMMIKALNLIGSGTHSRTSLTRADVLHHVAFWNDVGVLFALTGRKSTIWKTLDSPLDYSRPNTID